MPKMEFSLHTAVRMAMGLRTVCSLSHRDDIQHAKTQSPVKFMQKPVMALAHEVDALLGEYTAPSEDLVYRVIEKIGERHGLDKLLSPVHVYNGFRPERLLRKELFDRTSNLPLRMIGVVGSPKIPDSTSSDAAYDLGKQFAQRGIVVVCSQTTGILEPLLRGLKDHGGLSIHITHHRAVTVSRGAVQDQSGLISLPIVTPYSDGIVRSTYAAMSGRALLVLNGTDEKSGEVHHACVRAAMQAAYSAIPSILVNTKFPNVASHPLQVTASFGEVIAEVEKLIPIDPALPLEPSYSYFSRERRMPVSVLTGTKLDSDNTDESFTHRVGHLLAENSFFLITGSGPGAMKVVSQGAQEAGGFSVGITFFPSYLASNPNVDVPIVGQFKMERSDFMNLSAFAVVNLGGSHATVDELASARHLGKPIVNCHPSFPSEFFRGISGGSIDPPFLEARTPEETIHLLKGLIT